MAGGTQALAGDCLPVYMQLCLLSGPQFAHKSMKSLDLTAQGSFGVSVGGRSCSEEQGRGGGGVKGLLSPLLSPVALWELQGPPSPNSASRAVGGGADLHNGVPGTLV